MGDFIVVANKHCFLCLNPIPPPQSPVEQDPLCSSASLSITSLQHLSRYLKIDMGKVFNEGGTASPQLLATVQHATLKVELCAECIPLNEMCSKLCRKLEKIEMEIASCIGLIHSKLKRTETDNRDRSLSFGDPHDKSTKKESNMLLGKRRIVEVLRSEILEKCSNTIAIANSRPRVEVQKMTTKQVNSKSKQLKSSFITVPDPESQFKVEAHDPLQDDDMGNIHFGDDDYFLPNEEEESIGQQAISVPTIVDPGNNRVRAMTAGKMHTIHGDKYKCTGCSKIYSTRWAVNVHYKSKHAKIQYKCTHCGKVFNHLCSLNRHNKIVHGGLRS